MAIARSTMSMARSTPAQKPLGLARTMRIAGLLPLAQRGAFLAPVLDHRVEDHADGADRDGGIRDVERRKMRQLPMRVHEVDDVPESQPVDHVAHGARKDEHEPEAE